MKSRFINYVERYLRFQPASILKLRSADLNMVGRTFSKLPLNFTQQFSINNAVEKTLMDEWGEMCIVLVPTLQRKEDGIIILDDDNSEVFKEFVHGVIRLACRELLDDLGELHSHLIYILNLEKLIKTYDLNEVSSRVLWSFCNDVVSTGLLPYLQKEFLNPFSTQIKKEQVAEMGMNFMLAFSQECTLEKVSTFIKKFQEEKEFEKKLIYLDSYFLQFLKSIPFKEIENLKDIIILDLKYVLGITNNNDIHQKLIANRKSIWLKLLEKIGSDNKELENAILLGMQSNSNQVKKWKDFPRHKELDKWLNIRDNYFILNELLQYACFKNKKFSKGTIEILKEIMSQKILLEKSSFDLFKKMAHQSDYLKILLEAYFPNLTLNPSKFSMFKNVLIELMDVKEKNTPKDEVNLFKI